jgi:hypothetical protein
MTERRAGTVRLPNDLRAAIDRYADIHGMSRNAAISLLVAKGLAAEGFPTQPAPAGQ